MSTKIDIAKFNESLTHDGKWQGERVADCINSPDGDIIATAIGASILGELRGYAQFKPLYPKDIQIMLDAFIAASGMVETQQPMGGTVFQRKPTTTKETT